MSLNILYAMQNTGVNLLADAGAPILVKRTVDGLRQAGHRVRIVALAGKSAHIFAEPDDYRTHTAADAGISGAAWFVWGERVLRRVQRLFRVPYVAFFDSFRFYQVMRRQLDAVDVCHEYQGLFSVGAALACRKKGVPLVLTVDADLILERAVVGYPLRGWHAALARAELRWLYRQARAIICVSDAAKRHLVTAWHVPAEKITVIPNGVDTDLFGAPYDAAAIRAEFGLGDAPVVGFVGGFQRWHGIDGLAEAFARVKEAVPGAKLLLVGDGPAREMVDAALARFGVADDTIITGFLPQSRVPHLLSAVDVAVIPYPKLPQELWFSPLKLYEYMAAGKAIVASEDGQIAQVIESEKTGILFAPGDIGAMATGIIRVLKNDALREALGQAAQAQARHRHSWRQYIENMEKLYRQVLNEN